MDDVQAMLSEISEVVEKMRRDISPDNMDSHDMLELELQLCKIKSRLQDAFIIALGF